MTAFSISLRFGKVNLSTGVRLHYAEQGDPAGHAIILLHGVTDSWFSFSRVLPLIHSTYHTIALSQRGHGDSDRPESGYLLTDFAKDVIALMDEMGINSATIVGHSMGSHVAQRVAVLAPARVARLVLVGSATTIGNDVVTEFQKEVDALEDPVPESLPRDFQLGCVYQPVPEEFMNQVIQESLKLPARVWKAAFTGMLDDAPIKLSEILAPTLILWGEHDAFFSLAEQDLLAAGIENSVLKVYEETGHTPQWERPEQFVRDIEDFINRTEPR